MADIGPLDRESKSPDNQTLVQTTAATAESLHKEIWFFHQVIVSFIQEYQLKNNISKTRVFRLFFHIDCNSLRKNRESKLTKNVSKHLLFVKLNLQYRSKAVLNAERCQKIIYHEYFLFFIIPYPDVHCILTTVKKVNIDFYHSMWSFTTPDVHVHPPHKSTQTQISSSVRTHTLTRQRDIICIDECIYHLRIHTHTHIYLCV